MRCGHTRKTPVWPSRDHEKTIAVFLAFDGISVPLSKVSRQFMTSKLEKFIECEQEWKVLKCELAKIANHSYEFFHVKSEQLFLEEI